MTGLALTVSPTAGLVTAFSCMFCEPDVCKKPLFGSLLAQTNSNLLQLYYAELQEPTSPVCCNR